MHALNLCVVHVYITNHKHSYGAFLLFYPGVLPPFPRIQQYNDANEIVDIICVI